LPTAPLCWNWNKCSGNDLHPLKYMEKMVSNILCVKMSFFSFAALHLDLTETGNLGTGGAWWGSADTDTWSYFQRSSVM
jgi:hypothetical protein